MSNGVGTSTFLSNPMVGRFKATAVGANLRVVVQQPTAILRAMDMISPKYILKGNAHPLRGAKEAQEYSPLAWWKSQGYFDINTGRSLEDMVYENPSKFKKAESSCPVSVKGAHVIINMRRLHSHTVSKVNLRSDLSLNILIRSVLFNHFGSVPHKALFIKQ